MTKLELIKEISERTQITQTDTALFLEALAAIGAEELKKENEFSLPGFGKLEVRQRNARTGRNPRTGESVEVPAFNRVVFKATKSLKEGVN